MSMAQTHRLSNSFGCRLCCWRFYFDQENLGKQVTIRRDVGIIKMESDLTDMTHSSNP
jgi:hypothetical protein